MATLAEIKTTVDNWLAARWPTLQSRQDTYASNHNGRYFQGKITHGVLPVDGLDSTADLLNDHPTDQAASWNDAISGLPAAFPCALVMDVYNGPQGWGYVATVYVRVTALAKTFARSQNVGSETLRTVAWHEVV